jgi:hypothetical protein
MKPEETEILSEGISRRRMLKRIGAGAAVAWTAPVLTSIRTPAFAQTGAACPDACNGGDFVPCTPDQPGCPDGGCTGGLGCFAQHDVEGNCHCFQNIFCSCPPAPCGSSSDCAPGQFCTDNGCGRTCLDCCGTNCRSAAGNKKLSGKTARK